jgi:hypothetical protein
MALAYPGQKGWAMATVSRMCRNCGIEQRQGARFCPRCGQNLEERPPADPQSTMLSTPVPGPNPESLGHDNSGDWHAATAPRHPYRAPVGPYQEPVSPPTAYQPMSPPTVYQPPVNRPPMGSPPGPYQPTASYQAPPAQQAMPPYQPPSPPYQPPSPDQQPYRPPFEPPRPAAGISGPSGPRRPPGPSDQDRRDRAPLIWSVLAAALVAAAVVFVLLLHPFGHHETAGNAANSSRTTLPASSSPTASSPTASASGSVSPTAAAVTERQAASSVAGMLTRSVSDRSAIVSADNDVASCGPNLASDAGVFTRAANSRTAILANLAAMPGRSALPAAVLSDLTKAWQASVAADQSLGRGARHESTHVCVPNDTGDPGYQASTAPDNEATKYKTEFTTRWNPIATRYSLTTYQPNQL